MIQYITFAILLSFTPISFGFHVLEGYFTATKECPFFHSFKKGKLDAHKQKTTLNKKYKILGDNKPGGEWLQILDDKKKPQWVHKQCGTIKITSLPPFEHFTLALSWHPTFCLTNPTKKTSKSYNSKNSPFVLHGLWPSTKKRTHPAYCLGQIQVEKCQFPPLNLNFTLTQKLKTIMPGVDNCLDRYQWEKHGTSSGMDANTYYTRAYEYTKWFLNSPVAKQFQKNTGKQVSTKEVLSWFKFWKIDHAVSIHCIKHNNQHLLQEVRLYLNKKLAKTPNKNILINSPYKFNTPDTFLLPGDSNNSTILESLKNALDIWPKAS